MYGNPHMTLACYMLNICQVVDLLSIHTMNPAKRSVVNVAMPSPDHFNPQQKHVRVRDLLIFWIMDGIFLH